MVLKDMKGKSITAGCICLVISEDGHPIVEGRVAAIKDTEIVIDGEAFDIDCHEVFVK